MIKIVLLCMSFSTIICSNNTLKTTAVDKNSKKIIPKTVQSQESSKPKKYNFFGFSDITTISITSFLTAIVLGIKAAHDNNTKTYHDDFLGLSFITPILTVPGISIILGIIFSKKINHINFLLPPYICIPTFYSTWLATHSLLQYSTKELK